MHIENSAKNVDLDRMFKIAWQHRENAFVVGPTKVGAAVMSRQGSIFAGCNIEHRFRCHDVHAEVNAITAMVAAGQIDLIAIVVVAEREQFTPCGGCLDWIMQFGGPTSIVARQSRPNGEITTYAAHDLMPYYPF